MSEDWHKQIAKDLGVAEGDGDSKTLNNVDCSDIDKCSDVVVKVETKVVEGKSWKCTDNQKTSMDESRSFIHTCFIHS